jgi:hypothetical protein
VPFSRIQKLLKVHRKVWHRKQKKVMGKKVRLRSNTQTLQENLGGAAPFVCSFKE